MAVAAELVAPVIIKLLIPRRECMAKKLPAGFTLIELLVTIGLIGVLFTIGIASYIDFSRRQIVFQAARKIVQDLRLAQSLAANNQKPQDPLLCGTLSSYTFSLDSDNGYTLNPDCAGTAYDGEPIKSDSIPPPPDLNLSGFTQVKFKVLRQTLECNANPCKLTVEDSSGHKKVISIGSGGAINIEGE